MTERAAATTEPELRSPYVSWDAFGPVLEKIRKRSPTTVDLEILQTWGISKANAMKTLPALKFLRIVDGSGKSLPIWERLGASDPGGYRAATKEMLETAYAKVLSAYPGAFAETDDKLADMIGEIYGSSPSTRKPAVTFLKRLLTEAGIRDESADDKGGQNARIGPRAPVRRAPTLRQPARVPAGESAQILNVHLHVGVPLNIKESELSDFIRRVASAAKSN